MKTAEDLFHKYCYSDDGGGYFMYPEPFKKALNEHDNEIKELIDEMIKDIKEKISQNRIPFSIATYGTGAVAVLTELRSKI